MVEVCPGATGVTGMTAVNQRNLTPEAPRGSLDDPERGGWVAHPPSFVTPDEADALFDGLRARAPWRAAGGAGPSATWRMIGGPA
jgi:hypothetical protein